jgi:hypothetical protein
MEKGTAHEWYLPRLTALVEEAAAAGFARDVSVAVVTDLINSPPFNDAPVADDENWNQDIGQPVYEDNPDTTISTGGEDGVDAPHLHGGVGYIHVGHRG